MQRTPETIQSRDFATTLTKKRLLKVTALCPLRSSILLALVLSSFTSCSQNNTSLKKEMIELDRVYIPTLLFTALKDTARSGDAIARLQITWERFHTNHYRDHPDTVWRKAFDRVGGLISRADGLLNTGDKTEAAHEALDEVRLILGELRRVYHLEIFSDHLTRFHESLEAILLSVQGVTAESLTDSALSVLQERTSEALTVWATVGTLPLDTVLYDLSSAELSELREWIDEESSHLEALNDALLVKDKQAIMARPGQIRHTFEKVYQFFGKNNE